MPKKRRKKMPLPAINPYPKEKKGLICPNCGAFMVLYKSELLQKLKDNGTTVEDVWR